MNIYRIHALSNQPFIKFWGGSDYDARARWAVTEALLFAPAGRDFFNYSEPTELYVDIEPTPLFPAILWANIQWWENLRETERYIFAVFEWRNPGGPWQQFGDIYQFIINHDPVANAGPDQIIHLDSTTRTIPYDIFLDGTASSDPDAWYPDHIGPLEHTWSIDSFPQSTTINGVVGSLATSLNNISNPIFLPVGTYIPVDEEGIYSFSLKVNDQEVATSGIRIGLPGEHSTTVRININVAPPELSIVSPKTSLPIIDNWHNNFGGKLYIPINYSLGNATDAAAFGDAWIVSITISQATPYPRGGSPPAGTILYKAEKISRNPTGSFVWDGVITEGPNAGNAALGSFTILLKLLDRNGQAIAGPGVPWDFVDQVTEPNALVIDMHPFIPPVDLSPNEIRVTGSFMESGHGAPANPHLHDGMDIGRGFTPWVGAPDIIAAASGLYSYLGGGTRRMEVRHSPARRTRYLHANAQVNPPNGSLVLQGQRLASMSNAGTGGGAPHLHFEYRELLPANVPVNPLFILDLVDDFLPNDPNVYFRIAQGGNQAARLAANRTGIAGSMDFIVHCRDRYHPDTANGANDTLSGPYGVQVRYAAGAIIGNTQFAGHIPGTSITDYYTHESSTTAISRANHYQLYFRTPAPAGRNTGPVSYLVQVYDFKHGLANSTNLTVTIGADMQVINQPPIPAITVGGGNTFQITIEVTNRIANLTATPGPPPVLATDNFHIALDGAPANWTVSRVGGGDPSRTGILPTGVATPVVLQIDSNGNNVAGNYNFDVLIYSEILNGVGSRDAISAGVQ